MLHRQVERDLAAKNAAGTGGTAGDVVIVADRDQRDADLGKRLQPALNDLFALRQADGRGDVVQPVLGDRL